MTAAAIILAHDNLERVEELVTALSKADFRVAVHVDRKTSHGVEDFQKACNALDNVVLAPRIACEWGRFSLVEASLSAAKTVLERWPDTSHVVQLSGSCLPVRPLGELRDFLNDNPDTNFIESVSAAEGAWVKDGLSHERFTLFFPFSFKKQRKLFDKSVDLQRWLKVKRKLIHGIEPHIGSQWWCLCGRTLKAILDDPLRPEFDRFFKLSWIPDEVYFQTLVRRYPEKIVSRSLTYHRFDPSGRPHLFYDDAIDALKSLDFFFARKIWPGSSKLYRELLKPEWTKPGRFVSMDQKARDAEAFRGVGRPGLLMQTRLPTKWYEAQHATSQYYYVFEGFPPTKPPLSKVLTERTGIHCLGRIFGSATSFPDGSEFGPGNISIRPRLRDYNRTQWLAALIWNSRDLPVSFMFDAFSDPALAHFLENDPNARIFRLCDVEPDTGLGKVTARPVWTPETEHIKAVRYSWDRVAFETLKEDVLDDMCARFREQLESDQYSN